MGFLTECKLENNESVTSAGTIAQVPAKRVMEKKKQAQDWRIVQEIVYEHPIVRGCFGKSMESKYKN